MSDTDPVTWAELGTFCNDRQKTCHELMEQRQDNHALRVENDRRAGNTALQSAIDSLRMEVQALKEILESHSSYVLPKPILYLVCAGMIGVGVAGEKLISVVMKHLGAG